MRKREPFNNPFAQLRLAKKTAPQKPVRRQEQARSVDERRRPSTTLDEAALFREAVGEVRPVPSGPALVAPPPPPSIENMRIIDPEQEALIQLSELVTGTAPFDISDADEYIEGFVRGFDAKIVRRLRAGDYAIQAHIDLHGLVRAEAKKELKAFIEDSRRCGRRCVLIVHGRGLHSKDQTPVLKESVQLWLGRGRMSKFVLAFASARPHDGGLGAVYVLLRRR